MMNRAPLDIALDPGVGGYEFCDHCNGYGNSLKDPDGVDRCSKCGGSGLQKKKEQDK
jgi:DnaJ-class molecular chaperone